MAAEVEQPQTIYHEAIEEGAERLRRNLPDLIVTAGIAGGEILFGAVTAATVVGALLPLLPREVATIAGALVFPIGFVLVLMGRSELFTENFLIPITRVLQARRRHDIRGGLKRVARLWLVSLVFNLVGAFIGAWLLTRASLLPDPTLEELRHMAEFKTSQPFGTAFWSAVQAGALMTLLTWLMLSVEGFTAKIVVIFAVGFVIELHHFNHVVVSAGQVFMGMLAGEELALSDWLTRNFIPAVLGNTVGGVGLVTGLRSLQVWTKQFEPSAD